LSFIFVLVSLPLHTTLQGIQKGFRDEQFSETNQVPARILNINKMMQSKKPVDIYTIVSGEKVESEGSEVKVF